MQRILLSLGMIVFVGALAAGATGAFFSDTETSTGNVFTAGAIDLTIDSTQHYNNMVCTEVTAGIFQWQPEVGFTPGIGHYPATGSVCDGTWAATDLGAQKFWNFGDIKPGDQGENTISLHIENNPAYACIDIGTQSNNENTNIEPEVTAGDVDLDPNGGELAQNINVIGWLDDGAVDGLQNSDQDPNNNDAQEGDNIWQVSENQLFPATPLSGFGATTTLTLADGGSGPALPGGSTSYVGMYWCAGTISGGAGNLSCSGASMGNDTQTDSATAIIELRAIQERNNSGFRCVPQEV
jgi:predicted ribosomally synthesized peptide with SipW-like signal peptide